MSGGAVDDLSRLLEARFADRRPRRLVRATTRVLGWIARHLPRSPRVRSAVDRALGPAAAWSIVRLSRIFDFASPSNDRYWNRLQLQSGEPATTLSPFLRAVYAWLGVEGAAMHYGKNFRLNVLREDCCVERLYLRDETGTQHGGCPWGLRRAEDGFACRTIMIGSRHVFDALPGAEMKIDIGIPEMMSIESMIAEQLRTTPTADEQRLWTALEPRVVALFEASNPAEGDFFVDGKLRDATASLVREMIATMKSGARPALFCQFRIIATPV